MATSYLLNHKNLSKGVKPYKKRMREGNGVIQQSDYLRKFLEKIRTEGLAAAYKQYGDKPPDPNVHHSGAPSEAETFIPECDYDVIIVGAGMAGISAAYELKRAGFSVKILEQTDRYGGRVYTYGGEKDHLAPGLYGEAGAMRLPGGVDDPNKPHFLADGYITQFGLKIKPFLNFDPNTLTHIYGYPTTVTSDWERLYFDEVWPNWKKNISEEINIPDIGTYYNKTTEVVINQLKKKLQKIPEHKGKIAEEIKVWNDWINTWSQFTLERFLLSTYDVIMAMVPDWEDPSDPDILKKLLPWHNDALRGFSVFNYAGTLDNSLVGHLRDDMGEWGSDNVHTLEGGMHSLAGAFFSTGILNENDLQTNAQVFKIKYSSLPSSPNEDMVEVSCYANDYYPEEHKYTAKAVILTTAVNILRQIKFEPLVSEKNQKQKQRKAFQAIEDIFTTTSTKIILQTKTRFWENQGIQGGFSRTNLPIGQIHYVKPDPGFDSTNQGILMIYTWMNEAMIFGSLTEDQVRQEVIDQIAEIHPEIKEDGMVETCIVHAWHNQPSYQGAYVLLKTNQYQNIRFLWEPMGNVYFAGDTISLAAGWVQGALESGLRAAYQVYERHPKTSVQKLSKLEKLQNLVAKCCNTEI